jgi:hypothetical protein
MVMRHPFERRSIKSFGMLSMFLPHKNSRRSPWTSGLQARRTTFLCCCKCPPFHRTWPYLSTVPCASVIRGDQPYPTCHTKCSTSCPHCPASHCTS